jgi:hypothetical protein
MTWIRLQMMYVLTFATIGCLVLCAGCGGDGNAQSVPVVIPTQTPTPLPSPAPTPTSAARPSLEMEGQGSLKATGDCSTSICPSGDCSVVTCPGIFTATVEGPPFGVMDVSINVITSATADPITSCYTAAGSGSINSGDMTISFTGKLCTVPNGNLYNLRGGIQIYTTNLCSVPWMATSGTFDAFGGVHTIGPTPVPPPTPTPVNPIPTGTNHAVISMIGATNVLSAPCPSP